MHDNMIKFTNLKRKNKEVNLFQLFRRNLIYCFLNILSYQLSLARISCERRDRCNACPLYSLNFPIVFVHHNNQWLRASTLKDIFTLQRSIPSRSAAGWCGKARCGNLMKQRRKPLRYSFTRPSRARFPLWL